MKKAVLKILVVIMAVCAMLCAFTACEDNNAADAPIHKHSFVDFTVNPTCAAAGYTLHKCACGEEYKDNFTDALSHNYINGKCALCGAADPNYTEPVEECTHDYAWTTVKEPTETEEGVKTGVCKKCGDTITQAIPTLSHEHNYIITVKAPTCTTNGYTLHKCLCGDEYKTDEKAALGHTSAEAIEENRIKATCTEYGSYDSVIYCSICHTEILRENKIIPATGHEFINYISDGNATYESDGTKTAYCNNGCGAKDTIPDVGSKLVHTGIKFNSLTTNGTNVHGKVPNEQTTFSFLTEISVSGNATFSVSYDINGNNKIPTKTANLNVGDNVFYVLEEVNGNASNLFTVTVRRRPIYTVSFNANGGTSVASRQIEEDNYTEEPTTTRAGYTFIEWDYDFNKPITKNTTVTASWVYYTLTTGVNNDKAGTITVYNETKITVGESETVTATTNDGYTFNGWYDGDNLLTNELSYTFTMPNENLSYTAKWTVNTNTKYLLEHYLEELDGNFTKQENDTVEKYGETDTLVTVQTTDIKEYEHFTHATVSQSVENANLNGDGSTVLKVYYLRDKYNFTVQNDNTKGGIINCTTDGSYKYDTEIFLSAMLNAGYVFVGWYNGETQISDKLVYKFNITEKTNITAKFFAKTDTKYTIEYYLEELDGSFTKQESDTAEKYGETDTLATVQATDIKEYEHFTHDTVGQSVERANLNGDESTVLKVYYSRNRYTIRFVAGGNVTLNKWYDGEYKYGYQIESVTATFNGYLGYDEWIGWHNGDNVLTYEQTIPSFKVDKDMDYTADFSIKPEISNFYFTSDTETCTVTGVKDKTITEIIVPNFVTSIGSYAFKNDTSLTAITIPDSITSIGNFAFSGCDNLSKIYYTGSINDWASKISGLGELMRYGVSDKTLCINNAPVKEIVLEGITEIKSSAFYKTNINSLTISGNFTSIGISAFSNCVSLTNVIIGSGVTTIGDYAFSGCSSLSEITISDSVTNIGHGAFEYCSSLMSIIIPDSVISIGYGAFEYCASLTEITIGNNVNSIGNRAFIFCTSLTEIIIPNKVQIVGQETFYGCEKLSEVIIGNNVTHIGSYAFYCCTSLKQITIPASVNVIHSKAFYTCTNLKNVIFNDCYGWEFYDGQRKVGIGSDYIASCLSNSTNAAGLLVNYTSYDWSKIGYIGGY